MKLFVINGPNLNMLGVREPEIYGSITYRDLLDRIAQYAKEKQIEIECYQSNHEGDLVDFIQKAYLEGADGIVINPGAYTHTSIALLDAIKAVGLPVVEVHISDLSMREEFRQVSYIRRACITSIIGEGTMGYFKALDVLCAYRSEGEI